ncbi:hypothetical protein [Pseudomonas fluorescens]|uniref:hypothetical protein n=1 Tax=Pseudomonas fluorescens TaxID=294 RepID=UPI001655DEB1|nr:hypothetical protein [Pseudomonas fluorescens]MBC8782836.1 hypothetical protein [Pseudomonas fluorescens]
MKWMFWVIVLLACIVCGLLGLTAGINMNPTSTVRFVPDWGSFADWVSGFGSVSAAVVALHLANLQRKNNTAKIEISQFFEKDNYTVDLVSTGDRTAIVVGVYIRSPNHQKQILLNRSPVEGHEKALGRYEYGEKRRITVAAYFSGLARDIQDETGNSNFDELQLVVATGIAEFKVKLDPKFAKRLTASVQPASR